MPARARVGVRQPPVRRARRALALPARHRGRPREPDHRARRPEQAAGDNERVLARRRELTRGARARRAGPAGLRLLTSRPRADAGCLDRQDPPARCDGDHRRRQLPAPPLPPARTRALALADSPAAALRLARLVNALLRSRSSTSRCGWRGARTRVPSRCSGRSSRSPRWRSTAASVLNGSGPRDRRGDRVHVLAAAAAARRELRALAAGVGDGRRERRRARARAARPGRCDLVLIALAVGLGRARGPALGLRPRSARGWRSAPWATVAGDRARPRRERAYGPDRSPASPTSATCSTTRSASGGAPPRS